MEEILRKYWLPANARLVRKGKFGVDGGRDCWFEWTDAKGDEMQTHLYIEAEDLTQV